MAKASHYILVLPLLNWKSQVFALIGAKSGHSQPLLSAIRSLTQLSEDELILPSLKELVNDGRPVVSVGYVMIKASGEKQQLDMLLECICWLLDQHHFRALRRKKGHSISGYYEYLSHRMIQHIQRFKRKREKVSSALSCHQFLSLTAPFESPLSELPSLQPCPSYMSLKRCRYQGPGSCPYTHLSYLETLRESLSFDDIDDGLAGSLAHLTAWHCEAEKENEYNFCPVFAPNSVDMNKWDLSLPIRARREDFLCLRVDTTLHALIDICQLYAVEFINVNGKAFEREELSSNPPQWSRLVVRGAEKRESLMKLIYCIDYLIENKFWDERIADQNKKLQEMMNSIQGRERYEKDKGIIQIQPSSLCIQSPSASPRDTERNIPMNSNHLSENGYEAAADDSRINDDISNPSTTSDSAMMGPSKISAEIPTCLERCKKWLISVVTHQSHAIDCKYNHLLCKEWIRAYQLNHKTLTGLSMEAQIPFTSTNIPTWLLDYQKNGFSQTTMKDIPEFSSTALPPFLIPDIVANNNRYLFVFPVLNFPAQVYPLIGPKNISKYPTLTTIAELTQLELHHDLFIPNLSLVTADIAIDQAGYVLFKAYGEKQQIDILIECISFLLDQRHYQALHQITPKQLKREELSSTSPSSKQSQLSPVLVNEIVAARLRSHIQAFKERLKFVSSYLDIHQFLSLTAPNERPLSVMASMQPCHSFMADGRCQAVGSYPCPYTHLSYTDTLKQSLSFIDTEYGLAASLARLTSWHCQSSDNESCFCPVFVPSAVQHDEWDLLLPIPARATIIKQFSLPESLDAIVNSCRLGKAFVAVRGQPCSNRQLWARLVIQGAKSRESLMEVIQCIDYLIDRQYHRLESDRERDDMLYRMRRRLQTTEAPLAEKSPKELVKVEVRLSSSPSPSPSPTRYLSSVILAPPCFLWYGRRVCLEQCAFHHGIYEEIFNRHVQNSRASADERISMDKLYAEENEPEFKPIFIPYKDKYIENDSNRSLKYSSHLWLLSLPLPFTKSCYKAFDDPATMPALIKFAKEMIGVTQDDRRREIRLIGREWRSFSDEDIQREWFRLVGIESKAYLSLIVAAVSQLLEEKYIVTPQWDRHKHMESLTSYLKNKMKEEKKSKLPAVTAERREEKYDRDEYHHYEISDINRRNNSRDETDTPGRLKMDDLDIPCLSLFSPHYFPCSPHSHPVCPYHHNMNLLHPSLKDMRDWGRRFHPSQTTIASFSKDYLAIILDGNDREGFRASIPVACHPELISRISKAPMLAALREEYKVAIDVPDTIDENGSPIYEPHERWCNILVRAENQQDLDVVVLLLQDCIEHII